METRDDVERPLLLHHEHDERHLHIGEQQLGSSGDGPRGWLAETLHPSGVTTATGSPIHPGYLSAALAEPPKVLQSSQSRVFRHRHAGPGTRARSVGGAGRHGGGRQGPSRRRSPSGCHREARVPRLQPLCML